MTKPVYSIDAPDQQRLKTARIEIEAVLKKHDLAGVVVLHTPGMVEYFYDIRPTYSVCWVDESTSSIRIASKLDRDHGGKVELQLHDQSATANMAVSIADSLCHAAMLFVALRDVVDLKLGVEHSEPAFVPDPRESNPS